MSNETIGVVGLGYVGLPLAVELAAHFRVVGYDRSVPRCTELRAGADSSREVAPDALRAALAGGLAIVDDIDRLGGSSVVIVAVPTPVSVHKQPDLGPLEGATRAVGQVIRAGTLVIFESTVYPGTTEEVCVPILEAESGLRCNEDFFVGYSPERINPGDKVHTLTNTVKITSGSTPEAAERVDALYRRIITAGTHKAASIKVAEAAKVIENTQRDVNIALMNELALIFERLGIDTQEVLDAAGTKWNFLPFKPGLVGGHCIGVDPYYLTHKAQEMGYQPSIIPASRILNESMGEHVASRVVRLMAAKRIGVVDARVLVMGLTFKENCPDLRNTKVVDIIAELQRYNAKVDVYDPWVVAGQAEAEYGLSLVDEPEAGAYDAIVLAVAHREFAERGAEYIRGLGKAQCVVYDVKGLLPKAMVDGRL